MEHVNSCTVCLLLILISSLCKYGQCSDRIIYNKGKKTLNETQKVRNKTERRSFLDNKLNTSLELKPFLSANNTHVTGQTDDTVLLHCQVGFPNATMVDWFKKNRRNEPSTQITLNKTTIIRDQRFHLQKDEKDWILKIKYVKMSDEGTYECLSNLSSLPLRTSLSIKEAKAEIVGGSISKTVKFKMPLRLSCIIKGGVEPPKYIFWYHFDRVINYELDDGATVRPISFGSELIFPKAEPRHAGNYTCVPSNARQASVFIMVNYNNKTFETLNGNKGNSLINCTRDSVYYLMLLVVNFGLYR